ncbi:MAG: transcriptional regulator [Candidatus Asgardarchaeia archaeon]
MMTYCEFITKYVLPEIRALIVKRLRTKYNMTQEKIAKALGITQAAVSYYITAKRGYKLKELQESPEINKLIDRVVDKITEKGFDPVAYADALCELCKEIRERKLVVPMAKKFGKKIIMK